MMRISEHCTGEAEQVDHVIPVSVAPELELDLDNGLSCCRYCHATKTAQEASARSRARVRRTSKRAPRQHPGDVA